MLARLTLSQFGPTFAIGVLSKSDIGLKRRQMGQPLVNHFWDLSENILLSFFGLLNCSVIAQDNLLTGTCVRIRSWKDKCRYIIDGKISLNTESGRALLQNRRRECGIVQLCLVAQVSEPSALLFKIDDENAKLYSLAWSLIERAICRRPILKAKDRR